MNRDEKAHVSEEVLNFYKTLPFNFPSSVGVFAGLITAGNAVLAYPVLVPLLSPTATMLDVGCGAGWLANSVSFHYSLNVLGIDFNPAAIERARQVAAYLRLSTRFEVQDLFRFEAPEQYDLVTSIGVLHHTGDCKAAIGRLGGFVKPGGHLFIGLYHKHGRKPFLDHFASLRSSGADERALMAEYARLHSAIKDPLHLRSWFRDQVMHPHETHHTLKELTGILEPLGYELKSTSLNGFRELNDVSLLDALEESLHEVGLKALAEGRYYPGFFLGLYRRK